MSAMTERTCAACDCELDAETIKVKIGGQTVEVCCDDCAQALREADASTSGGE
jgi:hypothetical protein